MVSRCLFALVWLLIAASLLLPAAPPPWRGEPDAAVVRVAAAVDPCVDCAGTQRAGAASAAGCDCDRSRAVVIVCSRAGAGWVLELLLLPVEVAPADRGAQLSSI